MSEQKWTKEPWETETERFNETDFMAIHGDGSVVAREIETAEAKRIVACVNACAGIEDPVAALEAARKLAAEGLRYFEGDGDILEELSRHALKLLGGTP